MTRSIDIRRLQGEELTRRTPELATILRECVQDGASVGFMDDMSELSALEFWQRVAVRAQSREVVLLGALVGDELAGTVQLIPSPQPNQPHRADVAKLLVSPRFRRMGIASSLMEEIEEVAHAVGRNLLVLDTLTGTGAETLYLSLAWEKVGEIPRYALLPEGGEPLPTSVFYKDLRKLRS